MWWWLDVDGDVAMDDMWNEDPMVVLLLVSIPTTLPFGGEEEMDDDPEDEVDPESLSLDPPLLPLDVLPSNKTQMDPFSPMR